MIHLKWNLPGWGDVLYVWWESKGIQLWMLKLGQRNNEQFARLNEALEKKIHFSGHGSRLAILPQCQHPVALLQMRYNKRSWLSDKKFFYLCCIIQPLSLFGNYAHATAHLVSVNSSLSSNLILPMNQRIWHFLTTWLRDWIYDRQNFYLLGNGSYMVKTWSLKINVAWMPLQMNECISAQSVCN